MVLRVPVGLVLVSLLAASAIADSANPAATRVVMKDNATARIAGVWQSDADLQGAISVSAWGDGQLSIRAGKRFDAAGFFRAGEFVGLTRQPGNPDSATAVTHGVLRVRLQGEGAAIAEFSPGIGQPVTRRENWRLEGRFGKGERPVSEAPAKTAPPTTTPGAPPVVVSPPGDTLPAFGAYVYVEELPEAIHRVPPVYPVESRARGISGTVVVQALVGKDGFVKNTVVVKSITGLDEAAIACVKQWRFHPAMAKGEPVAVWVAIPVGFRLN
jgi:TonB family protein